ncbi:two-component system sensor histidine kinase NtrB [Variovorax sp.]|jgi:two-component system, NtrC family, sensor histidine kinase PilS|uniref:two-component system sensor histidine kinase NtrB n=1 Tax=Variovorax sp. TaxID=1871043 RepID=UPI0008F11DBE|nr:MULTISPECIES: PAS domain-containing sensor histidine kinase [unclassified Variovorax]TAJ63549.1 MAG: PAS domain-containing sensor histidine kinase [Variovorax sp.]SFP84803.1 two-component system, NtrC family, sensor histidine kinase PilS [Variovorax sp. PDC80]
MGSSSSLWASGEPVTDWDVLEPGARESAALLRLWRGFMGARCFVALVLVLLQGVSFALGQTMQPVAVVLSASYLAAAALGARYVHFEPPMRGFGATWMLSTGVDLAVFAALQVTQGGNINYTPLFALPVLMSAVLGTVMVSMGTTATVTLLLLADAAWHWVQQPGDSPARFVQAALTGTGLFVVALLAHELARRLAREEAVSQHNRSSAQMQAQVNDLVIETLSEGVLVIDAEGLVHAANPAADAILGQGLGQLRLPFPLHAQPAWHALAALARQTYARRESQSEEIPVAQARGAAREVRVRTRLTPSSDQRMGSLCVMFLQDLRELEARIRTEKLAAMGRMSAAVAHEIRNPLAAITQASALLNEDLTDPAHRQLTHMVQHNAQRLARIVDDVLDVSRARQQRVLSLGEQVVLDPTVQALTEEWMRQTQRKGVTVVLDAPGVEVRFDVEHLRRLLVNLLDNAARYASLREGAIQVVTTLQRAGSPGRPTLQVWSDGAPLEPAVQRHLFEPFFSSESRSSGLGLFLCRELCRRHGAAIGYERRALAGEAPEGNEFFVGFAASENRLTQ